MGGEPEAPASGREAPRRGMVSLPFQRRQYIMPQILCALCPSAGNETKPLRDQTQAVPSLMRWL